MKLPEMSLPVKVVLAAFALMEPLLSVQLPLLLVTQLLLPPGEKVALTVALATVAVVLRLRTVTMAEAAQLPPVVLVALPIMDLKATGAGGGSTSVAPIVESSKLGEPLPMEDRWLSVALANRVAATAAGVAVGLAPRVSAATPVTCGEAMEVPLMVLLAVMLVYQAEVMLLPGANRSTHLPIVNAAAIE